MTHISVLNRPAAQPRGARPRIALPSDRKSMRIALFSGNYACTRDGANRALNRLVGHLLAIGAEVRVYSPTVPDPPFVPTGDVVSVPSVGLPGRKEYRLALGLPRSTRRDLDAFAPNLIHVSAPDWLGRSAQAYARQHGVPVIASLHTRFETYLGYYRLGLLRRRMEAYLDRFYRDCDHILVPTPPIAAEFAARFDPARISIWSRGVDRASFHPGLRDEAFRRAHGYAPDDVVPLFFGRLVLEKGLDMFVDALQQARLAGFAVPPLIVGDGPARSWIAERLPGARFTGHLEGAALGRAVASADVLINPSVTEAFGNVNLEAMASGLAVVSADVPSASALIAHGRTGMLVSPLSSAAYAGALVELAADPARRQALGEAASLAADAYAWREVLDSVVHAYDSRLAPRRITGDSPRPGRAQATRATRRPPKALA